MRTCLLAFPIALALSLNACADHAATPSTTTAVRDSAGITIVENRSPSWTEATAWRLSDSPTLRMGVMAGDSAQEFYGIAGVVRLSDGTIVVANSGTHELRYYRATGTLVTTAGRQGDGPGEFQGLMSLVRIPADTVGAIDVRHRRLSVFDPGGRFARDVPLSSNLLQYLGITGQFGDGTFLASAQPIRTSSDLSSRPLGPARDSLLVVRVDASGAVVDTIGLFPGNRVTVKMIEMGGASIPLSIPVAFAPTTQLTAGSGTAYVGVPDTYEIGVYSPSGKLLRLIRRAQPPRVVSEADKAGWRDRMRAQSLPSTSPRMRQTMQTMLDALANPDFAEIMPAFRRLLVDAAGDLWVSDYQGSDSTRQHLSVFDPGGRLLGTVVLPQRLMVTEIGADYVLGHTTDETEVEHVELYALIKPAG
jgi:hypothetical protein